MLLESSISSPWPKKRLRFRLKMINHLILMTIMAYPLRLIKIMDMVTVMAVLIMAEEMPIMAIVMGMRLLNLRSLLLET